MTALNRLTAYSQSRRASPTVMTNPHRTPGILNVQPSQIKQANSRRNNVSHRQGNNARRKPRDQIAMVTDVVSPAVTHSDSSNNVVGPPATSDSRASLTKQPASSSPREQLSETSKTTGRRQSRKSSPASPLSNLTGQKSPKSKLQHSKSQGDIDSIQTVAVKSPSPPITVAPSPPVSNIDGVIDNPHTVERHDDDDLSKNGASPYLASSIKPSLSRSAPSLSFQSLALLDSPPAIVPKHRSTANHGSRQRQTPADAESSGELSADSTAAIPSLESLRIAQESPSPTHRGRRQNRLSVPLMKPKRKSGLPSAMNIDFRPLKPSEGKANSNPLRPAFATLTPPRAPRSHIRSPSLPFSTGDFSKSTSPSLIDPTSSSLDGVFGHFANSTFQNSPKPDHLPKPRFLEDASSLLPTDSGSPHNIM